MDPKLELRGRSEEVSEATSRKRTLKEKIVDDLYLLQLSRVKCYICYTPDIFVHMLAHQNMSETYLEQIREEHTKAHLREFV